MQDIGGGIISTNQYSTTEHFRSVDIAGLPGVFFFYDLSPIKVCLLCYRTCNGMHYDVCYVHTLHPLALHS